MISRERTGSNSVTSTAETKYKYSIGEINMASRVLVQCHSDRLEGTVMDLANPVVRAARLTGLSRGTLLDIQSELKDGDWPQECEDMRGKYQRVNNNRSLLPKIHETVGLRLLHQSGIMATIPILREKLSFHHGVLLSRSLLSKLLKTMGYEYKVPAAEQTVFVVETHEMRQMRHGYLANVLAARESGQTRVYMDESYVNKNHTSRRCWVYKGCQVKIPTGKGPRWILCGAGSKHGWIHTEVFKGKPDGDHHGSMNNKIFEV